MSELTRREAMSRLAMAFAGAGALDRLAAADVHALVGQRPGQPYVPQALTAGQYRTLERLTDLIIPVDGTRPGAVQAGVPAWIDTVLTVNAELKTRVTGGLAWLDTTMRTRHGVDFVAATPAQQTTLLDQIAYQKNRSADLNPGIDFFILARRMTVDGFYTSPLGMRDIYQGNQARQTFTVPREAMDYVINRSPLK